MQASPRVEASVRDTRLWSATRGSLSVAARSTTCPLVVTVTPSETGAFLDDGASVRRQLAVLQPLLQRSVAVHRRRRRAEQVILLAPSAWLRLAWPAQAHGDRAALRRGLARHLESLLGDAFARLGVDAVVFGAHFAAPRAGAGDFDGVFVFDGERGETTWAGAAIAHGRAGASGPVLVDDAERDSVAHVPGLDACLIANDHELVALARPEAVAGVNAVAAARRLGARHVLHLGYGAATPGLWASRLARLRERLPDIAGWASTSRVTAAEPRTGGWTGLVGGVDHLPIAVRLADA
jgi:hypothetical protein